MLEDLKNENEVTQEVSDSADTSSYTEKSKPENKESEKEYNFRIMRERVEAAERRAAELERLVAANLNQNQQSTKLEVVEDEDDIPEDDSYIEHKSFKKYYKKQKDELRQVKKMLKEASQYTVQANAEWRLRSRYPDFDQVVNADNIRKLSEQKPSIYKSLMSHSDLYEKGEGAYEIIKNMINAEKYEYQDKKIEENKIKPRAAAAAGPQAGESPLARVPDYDRRILTEEKRRQIIAASNRAIESAS